jgi:hypothetical protein
MIHRLRVPLTTVAALAVVSSAVAGCDDVVLQEDPGVTAAPARVSEIPLGDAVVRDMATVAAEHAYAELVEAHPQLQERGVFLEPGYPVPGGSRNHDPEMIGYVARGLNARLTPRDEVVRCADGPKSCWIEEGGVVVRLFEPLVDGTDGRVTVSITYELPDLQHMPVYSSVQEVLLRQIDGRWEVVGIGMRAAT